MVWDSFHILQRKDKMRIGKYFLVLLVSFLLSACCGLRCQFESSMNGKVGYYFQRPEDETTAVSRYFHQSEKERRYEKIREDEEEEEYLFYFRTRPQHNFKCLYTLTVNKKTQIVTAWKEIPDGNGDLVCYGNH